MSDKKKDSKAPKTPRTPRDRFNKIYRCPPTPTQSELQNKEKGFVIDTNAVASISSDYSKANPKLGPVIPPYNSQKDRDCDNYFGFIGVNTTLKKTGQFSRYFPVGCSIEGVVMERFHTLGAGYKYLSTRNRAGSGECSVWSFTIAAATL